MPPPATYSRTRRVVSSETMYTLGMFAERRDPIVEEICEHVHYIK